MCKTQPYFVALFSKTAEGEGATGTAVGSALATYSGNPGLSLGCVGQDVDFDLQYVVPVTRARRQGFSPGTPASSHFSQEIVQPITKFK